MKLGRRKTTLKQLLVAVALLSLVSVAALGVAVSRGVRSNDWLPVPAVITRGTGGFGSSRAKLRFRWRTVKVNYTFDDTEFEKRVALFSSLEGSERGTNLTVFVNPENPDELSSEKGFLACDYAIPMSCTIGSIAFLIVLLCIIYSPTDDYESEVNDGNGVDNLITALG